MLISPGFDLIAKSIFCRLVPFRIPRKIPENARNVSSLSGQAKKQAQKTVLSEIASQQVGLLRPESGKRTDDV